MKSRSMILWLLAVLFIVNILVVGNDEESSCLVQAKKKKSKTNKKVKKPKKTKPEKLPEMSSPERPSEINEWHYCFGCLAMSEFAMGFLGDKDGEADILDAIDPTNMCESENYVNNPNVDLKGVNPVIINDACSAILASYEDELIATLKKRHAFAKKDGKKQKILDHVKSQFCMTTTRACHGIDTSQLNMNLVDSFDKFKQSNQDLMGALKLSEDPQMVKLGERMKKFNEDPASEDFGDIIRNLNVLNDQFEAEGKLKNIIKKEAIIAEQQKVQDAQHKKKAEKDIAEQIREAQQNIDPSEMEKMMKKAKKVKSISNKDDL